MVGNIIEASLVLIALFLVVTNAQGFSDAANSVGGVYVNAVKALQGR
jgi:hypothetical protein